MEIRYNIWNNLLHCLFICSPKSPNDDSVCFICVLVSSGNRTGWPEGFGGLPGSQNPAGQRGTGSVISRPVAVLTVRFSRFHSSFPLPRPVWLSAHWIHPLPPPRTQDCIIPHVNCLTTAALTHPLYEKKSPTGAYENADLTQLSWLNNRRLNWHRPIVWWDNSHPCWVRWVHC